MFAEMPAEVTIRLAGSSDRLARPILAPQSAMVAHFLRGKC